MQEKIHNNTLALSMPKKAICTGRMCLILQCPTHTQIHQEMWPDHQMSSDPGCIWSYLERIGEVTPRPGMRDTGRPFHCQPTESKSL